MIVWVVALQLAAADEATVRVRRIDGSPATTQVTVAEASGLAGSLGDFARAVDALPGAARPSYASGALILWGAAPSRSSVLVDGVPVPALFHGGGLRGVLQGSFVDAMELAPGAFGVEQGRVTGGVLSLSLATLDLAAPHATIATDLLDASFVVARPVGEHAAVAVGARAGYGADVLQAVAPPAFNGLVDIPRYGDYQARVEVRPDAQTTYALTAFGSVDASRIAPPTDDVTRLTTISSDAQFHRVLGAYTHRGEGSRTAVGLWLGEDFAAHREHVGAVPSDTTEQSLRAGLRASHARRVVGGLGVRVGADLEAASITETRSGSLLRPPREGDVYVLGQAAPSDVRADRWTVARASAGLWAEAPWTFAGGALTITPALRVDLDATEVGLALPPVGDTPPRGVGCFDAVVEPRIAVRARVARWLTLHAAGGRYAAPASAADLSSVFGNPTLGGSTAWHAVVGGRIEAAGLFDASVDAFVRVEDGIASRVEVPALAAALADTGTSRTFGLQTMLRVARGRRLSGWLTYTLLRSTVQDRPGAAERLADVDQTHSLAAVASVALGHGWRVGARVRAASGFPRTPVVGQVLDTLSGDAQPVFGATNSDRLPWSFRLDLRVEKTVNVGRRAVVFFVDVLNATNHLDAEEVVYDAAFRTRRWVTGLPLTADVGVRGEL